MRLDGCNALITGASAGIGREFARCLAGHAHSLVLVARREPRLLELRAELCARHPNLAVHVRAVDLSDPAQIDALVDSLGKSSLQVDFLINNAGLGDMGPFRTIDPVRLRSMLQVNVSALTFLTRKLLPPMIAQKRGAILNVSSSAAFLPIPDFAVYAATKAYVNSYSEALRQELRGTGVIVTALCPGPVHTEFTEVARRADYQAIESGPEFVYVTAAHVARAGLRAVERDLPMRIPGLVMKTGMAIVRLLPLAILRGASRFSAKRPRQNQSLSCI
jgi:short-subunit dehydrogenase